MGSECQYPTSPLKKIMLGKLPDLVYRFCITGILIGKCEMERSCPKCNSKAYKRNGYTRHGKQNHRCLDCGRQFSFESDISFVVDIDSSPQRSEGATLRYPNDSER